jgi:hypothetical protein
MNFLNILSVDLPDYCADGAGEVLVPEEKGND